MTKTALYCDNMSIFYLSLCSIFLFNITKDSWITQDETLPIRFPMWTARSDPLTMCHLFLQTIDQTRNINFNPHNNYFTRLPLDLVFGRSCSLNLCSLNMPTILELMHDISEFQKFPYKRLQHGESPRAAVTLENGPLLILPTQRFITGPQKK